MDNLDQVKDAVFAAGAGRLGHYDRSCWQVLGQGQFRPIKGSTPGVGKEDKLEIISEYKVEMICDDDCIEQVLLNFKQAHPYEEPAFDVWRLDPLSTRKW
jgi:hypothetical protein